ncbi:hypothetical protein HY620_03265 [Candidatus Uhrbacteria bacterium]|nr:hypothetical protein [Candidatus Uhrbacteria bacterium]
MGFTDLYCCVILLFRLSECASFLRPWAQFDERSINARGSRRQSLREPAGIKETVAGLAWKTTRRCQSTHSLPAGRFNTGGEVGVEKPIRRARTE